MSIFFILSRPRSMLPNTFLEEAAFLPGVSGAPRWVEGVANQSALPAAAPPLDGVLLLISLMPVSMEREGESTGVLSSVFLARRGVSLGVAKFSLSSSCFCCS